jgi:hypothetical protein
MEPTPPRFQRCLSVLDIDDDMMVLLQDEDGLCLHGRYAAPSTVRLTDVREALKAKQDVEAVVIGCADTAGGGAARGVISVLRIHARTL